MSLMRITTGKAVAGQIVVEGVQLDEVARVTVLLRDETGFSLSDADEAELLEALAEADRDDCVDAQDVLDRLP